MTKIADAKEKGICPRCKDGNGRVFDAAGSRMDCYPCRGHGTWEEYMMHREYTRGWNDALRHLSQVRAFAERTIP